MYKKKPFFIVFEGIEGCGKSFQSKKLFNNLKKKGIKSLLTREPGGTNSAELIRNLILKDYSIGNKASAYKKFKKIYLQNNKDIKLRYNLAVMQQELGLLDEAESNYVS